VEKFVRVGFVVIGLLTWITVAAMSSAVFQFVNPGLDKFLLGAQFTVSDLVGLGAGVALAAVLWFNERVTELGLEVFTELRNVTWPTWPETRVSTIVVIITTIVVSIILGLFDALWGAVTGAIYGL